MRLARLALLFITLAVPFAVHAQKTQKPTPRLRTIEGRIYTIGGGGALIVLYKLIAGGKKYLWGVLDQNGYNFRDGTKVRVMFTKIEDCGAENKADGFLCFADVIRVVKIGGRR